MPRKAIHEYLTLSRRLNPGRIARVVIAFTMSWPVVSWPTVAGASPDFPTALQDAAGLECTPTCSVCHTSDPGARGTATRPFAIAMVEAGLAAGDASTVGPAFDVLDPDGDGVPEFDGGGVSNSGDIFPCQAEVEYGCGMSSKPSSMNPKQSTRLLWMGLLALGVGLHRRLFGRRSVPVR